MSLGALLGGLQQPSRIKEGTRPMDNEHLLKRIPLTDEWPVFEPPADPDQRVIELEAENKRLWDRCAVGVTVGAGKMVYGDYDAINRVQDWILLDSEHPVEKKDVCRSLMRDLQKAEAENTRLSARVEELEGTIATAAEWFDFWQNPKAAAAMRAVLTPSPATEDENG